MSENRKIAMVTGAGSGIGKATSLALLKAGYSVVLAGRRFDLLEQTLKEAAVDRTRALAVSADVCDEESVRRLFAETKQTFGRLDLLFNNAGIKGPTNQLGGHSG